MQLHTMQNPVWMDQSNTLDGGGADDFKVSGLANVEKVLTVVNSPVATGRCKRLHL